MSRFIFPDSDRRHLMPEELARLSRWQLDIARNEIFARHGRIFDRPDLRTYFSQFSWYRPQYREVSLNSTEAANVRLIQEGERRQ